MRIERYARRRALISLTPLIDVVFILLVFFMLAARLTGQSAMEVHSASRAAATPVRDDSVLVRIHAGGRLELNGDMLARPALMRHLQALLQRQPRLRVLVQPSVGVVLQQLVELLQGLEDAGVPNVSLLPTPEPRT